MTKSEENMDVSGRLGLFMPSFALDEIELELPDWYFDYEGNVSIKTPQATVLSYNKQQRSSHPFTTSFPARHYIESFGGSSQGELQNPDLGKWHIAIKPFGGEREYYEVYVTDTVYEEHELFNDNVKYPRGQDVVAKL